MIRPSYAVHCDFCGRIGPHRPQSHEARRTRPPAGYVEVYCDYYGNESWACPACVGADKVREFLATMRGEK